MPAIYHRGLRIITGRSSDLPGDLKHDPPGAREPHATGRPTRDFGDLSPAPEADPAHSGSWTMRIEGWMPTLLNHLRGHWAKASRLKRDDAQRVAIETATQHIPVATTKLRLLVLVVLPKGKRACDPDAIQKSLCDALVHAGALKNDSHHWVEHAPVRFARGDKLCTYVTLESL